MSRVAVVVPLRPGSRESARQLIEAGPPFEIEDTPLAEHCVYLTDYEAVFVFEGPDAREAVEHVLGEADVWQAATAWRAILASKPRLAETVFTWQRGDPDPLHVPGL
jgi:hypothetical protein